VPLTDVVLTEEDVDAVLECLEGGWLTMGPRTQRFEHAVADVFGVPHAIAVSSGTAALHLALLAAGVHEGDEVLVPALTFVAAAAAVRYCGATPVLIEPCGPHDLNIDPRDAARHVGPRTKAVLATHWMGYSCDLPAVERLCDRHGLVMIEDCAQSITARCADGRLTGTVGVAGCFSFFSKKQLCVGEGGMLLTSDEAMATKARLLRSHAMTSVTWDRHRGHAENYDVIDVGFNLRIDEPRAALGLSRLARLHDDVEARRALVRRYRELLSGHPGITIPWNDEEVQRSAHFGFTVLLESESERGRLSAELAARGVQTTFYPAISTLTAYADHPSLPRAEDLAARHLLLPLSSTFGPREVDLVVGHLSELAVATQ
jgi:dTDP-4-amino-4,6-dideoxygalactose transaminase